jgi:hypothetical protein
LKDRLRRWSRRSREDNDIVISTDKSVSEQAANEATAPRNDDAIPQLPIQLKGMVSSRQSHGYESNLSSIP